jgi:hypothetical protein
VLKLARAEAAIRGREFMLPDDVKRWRSRRSPTA